MSENEARAVRKGHRLTIGYLSGNDHISGDTSEFFLSVADVARERDVNLISFLGGGLRSSIDVRVQSNMIYELVSAERVDGLVVQTSYLGGDKGADVVERFVERFGLPMVSAGLVMEGVPSVISDDLLGMQALVTHLIEVHGYRRILFIRGPETNDIAEARHRGYVEALAQHDIPLDPRLVSPSGNWGTPGDERPALLLDERGLRPGDDFDVAVAVNDRLALRMLETLTARGIRVPRDVAVVGFDDRTDVKYVTPPLTTVGRMAHESARRAAEMLLDVLDGQEVPEVTVLSPQVVVRQSCGCVSPAISRAAMQSIKSRRKKLETVLATQREEFVDQIVQEAQVYEIQLDPKWVDGLLDSLVKELAGDAEGIFLHTLSDILRQIAAAGGDVPAWHDVLSVIRRQSLPYIHGEALFQVDDLWQQARIAIGETVMRVQAHRAIQAQERSQILRGIRQSLLTTLDLEGLMDILAESLPQLGISSAYLSVYEDPQPHAPLRPAPEWSRIVLAYDQVDATDQGRIEIEEGGRRFESKQLVPADMMPERRYSFILQPLCFRLEQIGFVVFEAGLIEFDVYEALQGEISSALRGARLIQQIENRALQLQTAAEVASVVGSILDPDELIHRVVDLARERFDLYYAGLFLVEEAEPGAGESIDPNTWAVLRAGTGEAGRRMMAQGQRLAVGGQSMVGQCIADGKAHVAQGEDDRAVRFNNPLLPNTRSEMALPLISRGEVVGALTIQSEREAAFDEEDVNVLQTMASQLANALASARLVEQTEAALREVEATHRRYLRQAWSEYAGEAPATNYEATRANVAPLGDGVLDEVAQAVERRDVTIVHGNGAGEADHTALVAPISLRGEAIGALGIHADGEREWTPSEIALVRDIAERMAIAAENLRLLDQSQRRAAREGLLAELSARMRETLDTETVLKTAVQEMRRSLGLPEVLICLTPGPPEEEQG